MGKLQHQPRPTLACWTPPTFSPMHSSCSSVGKIFPCVILLSIYIYLYLFTFLKVCGREDEFALLLELGHDIQVSNEIKFLSKLWLFFPSGISTWLFGFSYVVHLHHPHSQHSHFHLQSYLQLAVEGPLTWRQFHRMAGVTTKGNIDDGCEPLPIISVTVGNKHSCKYYFSTCQKSTEQTKTNKEQTKKSNISFRSVTRGSGWLWAQWASIIGTAWRWNPGPLPGTLPRTRAIIVSLKKKISAKCFQEMQDMWGVTWECGDIYPTFYNRSFTVISCITTLCHCKSKVKNALHFTQYPIPDCLHVE